MMIITNRDDCHDVGHQRSGRRRGRKWRKKRKRTRSKRRRGKKRKRRGRQEGDNLDSLRASLLA